MCASINPSYQFSEMIASILLEITGQTDELMDEMQGNEKTLIVL